MITSPAKASDHRCPKGLVSRKVSLASGRSFVSERGVPQAGQLHETETEEHIARLEKVFKEIDETPSGKTCDAIIGIIEEGQEVMKEFKDMPALDAGILAAAQAVEHYEIARYGTLKTWAGARLERGGEASGDDAR
jgi:ferritin-like metal-binding protein YciE